MMPAAPAGARREISMLQPLNASLLPAYVAALAFGYFCGSIPFGLIVTRLAGAPDIRSIGSGNIGATNVLRTGRKGLAAATLVGDALKGTAAVLAVYAYYGRDYLYFAHELALPAALGAFLGHVFPVWLGFKGGKGVATYLGILLALAWPVAIGFCLVWLAVAAITRYSSLAALIASAATPFALWALEERAQAALLALLTVLLWVMHRGNIARLIKGTEGKIGRPAAKGA
jgi:glycerol-3-phosphate acyltransferase PlsY